MLKDEFNYAVFVDYLARNRNFVMKGKENDKKNTP